MGANLGIRLKQLIEEMGLEQKQVAKLLEVKSPTFNGYINSRREPTLEMLKHFATYFGVSVDYLTGHSDIKNPYLNHLSDELINFIYEPRNTVYIELAMDIKHKTLHSDNKNKKVK